MGFDETLESLLTEMSELAHLCEHVGEQSWADWAHTALTKLRGHDAGTLTGLTRAFGGMGSLNDLVIHPLNGHEVAESDISAVTERLHVLRGRIYRHAQELLSDLHAPSTEG